MRFCEIDLSAGSCCVAGEGQRHIYFHKMLPMLWVPRSWNFQQQQHIYSGSIPEIMTYAVTPYGILLRVQGQTTYKWRQGYMVVEIARFKGT